MMAAPANRPHKWGVRGAKTAEQASKKVTDLSCSFTTKYLSSSWRTGKNWAS